METILLKKKRQIAWKIMLLVNNLHWQASQRVKTNEILSARAICNFHSYYMKNALVFIQSDARYVFCVGRLLLMDKWSSSSRYGFLSPFQLNK